MFGAKTFITSYCFSL